MILQLLGLDAVIKVVQAFPGNGDDSWFFEPVSAWEKSVVANQESNERLVWESARICISFISAATQTSAAV